MSATRHAAGVAAAMLIAALNLGQPRGEAGSPQRLPQPPVSLQPLAQQVRRVEAALAYLGQPLPATDHEAINEAISARDEEEAVERLQTTIDKYVLAFVEISPESRVKVEPGPAKPVLVEGGTRLFRDGAAARRQSEHGQRLCQIQLVT